MKSSVTTSTTTTTTTIITPYTSTILTATNNIYTINPNNPNISNYYNYCMSKQNTYVVAVDKSPSATATTLSPSNLSQTALAKFNRIIDNTVVPSSNYCYTSKLIPLSTPTKTIVEKSKSLLPESSVTTIGGNNVNNIVNSSYMEKLSKISSEQEQQEPTLRVLNNPNEINKKYSNYYNNYYSYDNQTKRNDVHYLLKQLNSFSDIEEIEIADMKKSTSTSFSIVNRTASAIATATAAATCGIRTAPTETSTSTSTFNYNKKYYDAVSCNNGRSYNQIPQQQNDYDYNLFQSCHYLETSCFATTITTAIAGSSSHEFRPSHSTNSSSLNEYGTCAAAVVIPFVRHSNGIAPRTRQPCSSGNSPCSIDLPTFLPSHNNSPHQHLSDVYSTTSRLSGSGDVIQTELSSLSAKNHSTNSSLGDTASDERRKPFFKCCYTPIDRWRQKRSHANANANTSSNSGRGNGVGGTNGKPNSHKSGVGNAV